jgi:hypothetical protein
MTPEFRAFVKEEVRGHERRLKEALDFLARIEVTLCEIGITDRERVDRVMEILAELRRELDTPTLGTFRILVDARMRAREGA